MKWTNIGCALAVFIYTTSYAQVNNPATPTTADTASINALLRTSKEKINEDPDLSIKIAHEARVLAEKSGYQRGVATAMKNLGTAYYVQGRADDALARWQEALHIFENAKDSVGVADLLGNIGIFFYNRGDDVKALDHYLRSLKIAESIGYKKGAVSALNNIGGVYYYKSATYNKALQYYLMALPLCEELGDKNVLGAISVNVGNIYLKQGDDNKALPYFNTALKAYAANPVNIPSAYIGLGSVYLNQNNFDLAFKNYQLALNYATKTAGKLNIVRSEIGLANLYLKKEDHRQAISNFKRAEAVAKEIDATLEVEGLYKDLAIAYEKTGDFKNAYHYQTLFTQVKDSLYNVETDKRVAGLQYDFDLTKKQNEINLLTKDKSIKALELKKEQTFRNALAIVLLLGIIVVLALLYSYRLKARSNRILDKKNGELDKKNMEIESLLLNILPAEVAEELKLTGRATPRNYETVSVMFTDFRSFTTITSKMEPQELVEELGNCFMAFDNIIERHGLEKIKTIGDAYMCAGGLPTPEPDHVFRMVKASLEIQEYVYQSNQLRTQKGHHPWDIRIGIHVGPVVAGVVGKKKYAYDIWGSTVNIASRMESSGMPGRVNVSSAAYEIIKEKYACVYRGKIQAKNVGEIDMYLIDYEIKNPAEFTHLAEAASKEEKQDRVITNLLQ